MSRCQATSRELMIPHGSHSARSETLTSVVARRKPSSGTTWDGPSDGLRWVTFRRTPGHVPCIYAPSGSQAWRREVRIAGSGQYKTLLSLQYLGDQPSGGSRRYDPSRAPTMTELHHDGHPKSPDPVDQTAGPIRPNQILGISHLTRASACACACARIQILWHPLDRQLRYPARRTVDLGIPDGESPVTSRNTSRVTAAHCPGYRIGDTTPPPVSTESGEVQLLPTTVGSIIRRVWPAPPDRAGHDAPPSLRLNDLDHPTDHDHSGKPPASRPPWPVEWPERSAPIRRLHDPLTKTSPTISVASQPCHWNIAWRTTWLHRQTDQIDR